MALGSRAALALAALATRALGELKVIGAGLPRTGTESLATALTILGYRGSEHDECNPPTPCQEISCRIISGGPVEPLFDLVNKNGWESISDEPLCLFYEALMGHFPKAKVILTERDSADQWYDSYARMQDYQWGIEVDKGSMQPREDIRRKFKNNHWNMCDQLPHEVYNCPIFYENQTEEVRNGCLSGYNDYNAKVKSVVPSERLLVYNVKEGWEPLCRFLGVPVPKVPFPFNNRYMDYLRIANRMQEPQRRFFRQQRSLRQHRQG